MFYFAAEVLPVYISYASLVLVKRVLQAGCSVWNVYPCVVAAAAPVR